MSNRHLALAVGSGLVALALTCAPAPLFAQPPPRRPQEAAANASFNAAQKLYDQRKYADALILFRTAQEASDSPNAQLMVAHCLIELGALAEAYDELQATMRAAAALAPGSPKYARTRDTAATEITALERRIGRLVLVATDLGAGAAVTINGSAVPPERLGLPIAVVPGTKIIELTQPGAAARKYEVMVLAGEMKTVKVRSSSAAAPAPVPVPVPVGGGVRVAGFVVAGVGVVGAVVLAVTAPLAQSKFSTLEQECGGVRCVDKKYGSVIDSGRTLDTLSTVGLAVGVAGLVSGGLMIGLGGPSTAPTRAAISVSPAGAQLRYEIMF
ncbi:MAG: hypothetical protein ACMG6S_13550 [Byssovorax sp.]